MKDKKVLFLVQAGMIAAIYVVLTLVFAPISYGEIQTRISEALTVLPFFTPAAIPGLFVGCLLANILGGAALPDIIFGSLATLLGAVITYLLRKHGRFTAPIPPILANAIIIPFVLYYAYGIHTPLWIMAVTIGLGELFSAGLLGMLLLFALDRHKARIFGADSTNS